jgi:hypothetical protein
MEKPKEIGRRNFLKGIGALGVAAAVGGGEAQAENSEPKLEFITQERVEGELQWLKDTHGERFINPDADFSSVNFEFDVDRESLDIYFDFDGERHMVSVPFRYKTQAGDRDTAMVSEGGYMYETWIISGLTWIYMEDAGLVEPF